MDTGIMMENPRPAQSSSFDRLSESRLSFGLAPDFDLGTSAWNSTSRVWATRKSFLGSPGDESPVKDSPSYRDARSSYVSARHPPPPVMTADHPDSENALQAKVPWSFTPSSKTSAGFSRGVKPLSPTTQRSSRGIEFFASPIDQVAEETSLFVGSSPDVEEGPWTDSHLHPRGGYADAPAPAQICQFSTLSETGARGAAPDANPSSTFVPGFAAPDKLSSAYEQSGRKQGPTHGQSAHRSSFPLPGQPAYFSLRPTFGDFPDRANPASPRYDRPPAGATHAPRASQYAFASEEEIDSAIRTLRSYSLTQGQERDAGCPRATNGPRSQYAGELHPPKAHPAAQPYPFFDSVESSHPTSSAKAPTAGLRPDAHATAWQFGYVLPSPTTLSPLASEYRGSGPSTIFSASGTTTAGSQTPTSGLSSRASYHDSVIMDRKFSALEQFGFDQQILSSGAMQMHVGNRVQFDMHPPGAPVRMSGFAYPSYLPGHPNLAPFPPGPRLPHRECDQSQALRSPLLEEFRLNGKTSRRFELKDIYNHVVEFCGDQHGSRFIQQKLETANSDEKEQIFKEIQPNLLQLMTDLFGNYVIQKMFEHGSQSQKKVLANQMKGHVQHLSTQMYGCRVVQKAFEHVLTDQQASLVKELDGPNLQILKTVKDQHGNHVVQKAIERIPGEHVQFIVDAHRGQMAKMSTHQYGCRVAQRMLEYCGREAKRAILDELLEHIVPLISDSYGNYVVQHIIQNGEPQDRRLVIGIVLRQLLPFSKHKFASNIVEKSIDYADEDQRVAILRGLTAADEHGETPVLGLMRDQYGNYVLQKVHAQLHGAELLALEADMKQHYPILRRISYGKQVTAIEKLLFGGSAPSTATASARSSAPSSTTDSGGFVTPQAEAH